MFIIFFFYIYKVVISKKNNVTQIYEIKSNMDLRKLYTEPNTGAVLLCKRPACAGHA